MLSRHSAAAADNSSENRDAKAFAEVFRKYSRLIEAAFQSCSQGYRDVINTVELYPSEFLLNRRCHFPCEKFGMARIIAELEIIKRLSCKTGVIKRSSNAAEIKFSEPAFAAFLISAAFQTAAFQVNPLDMSFAEAAETLVFFDRRFAADTSSRIKSRLYYPGNAGQNIRFLHKPYRPKTPLT